jgi:hypothetical protein
MSNGESPDGFVFPPFIPPSAARTPAPPPPATPAPAPAMPWDLEAPAAGDAAPEAAQAEGEAPAEELPWLELPEPREPAATVVEAEDDGPLPEWMTWDARAEADAEAELSGTPAVEGLEEFDPVASFGVPEAPAAAGEDAEEEAFPFGEADTFPYGEPEQEAAGEEPSVGGLSGLELEPGYGFDAEADAGGHYPAEAMDEGAGFAPEPLEDPFAAAEPAAGTGPFVADVEAVLAAEPEPAAAAGETAAEPWEGSEADAVEAVEELRGVEEPAEEAAGAPGAFDEVAARLEEIARMLRERPDELLAGRAGDPLALLVTGYVMGYGHGRRG